MDAITEQSAVALAAAIRSGQTTAREVVEAHIELLVRVNPMINAVIADRYDAARREADAADARIAAAEPGESLPPLLGVPCTVKESLALAGMPHSAGVVARQGQRATTTATVVARAMNAGAIPLGVTNTSELCLWVESENRLYGRTRNPYDPSRIAGGSSGGEAAAIGSGGSPFGLGSDIGGSIWIPAFCCGVFGHKPSRGLVPATGAWPPLSGDSGRLYSNGPLARRAEDLMPLLRVMAGPDGVDRQTIPVRLGDPAEVSLGGLTVLLTDDAWLVAPSDELLAARERAAGALAAAGARIRRRRMPALRRAVDAYVTTLARSTGVTVREVLGSAGAGPVGWRDLLRRGGPHTVADPHPAGGRAGAGTGTGSGGEPSRRSRPAGGPRDRGGGRRRRAAASTAGPDRVPARAYRRAAVAPGSRGAVQPCRGTGDPGAPRSRPGRAAGRRAGRRRVPARSRGDRGGPGAGAGLRRLGPAATVATGGLRTLTANDCRVRSGIFPSTGMDVDRADRRRVDV